MGHLCSRSKLQYDTINTNETSRYSVSQENQEWTLLSRSEMDTLLNQIHLCPFEDERLNILNSLQTRLITIENMYDILKLLSDDREKLNILDILSGNINNKSNWKLLLPLFDPQYHGQVEQKLVPVSRTTSGKLL